MNTLRVLRGAWLTAFLAAGLLVVATPCRADLIVSTPASARETAAPRRAVLESRLVASGLSAQEARDRAAELHEADLQTLGENPAQLQLAGDLGAGVLLIAAGVVIFVLLWLIGTDKIDL